MGEKYINQEWHRSLKVKGQILSFALLQPEHKSIITNGFNHLSSESIRHRFFGPKKELTERELNYLTHMDGENHLAIGIYQKEVGIGIGRFVRDLDHPLEAEIAIVIVDDYQKMGLGSILIKLLSIAAIERNIQFLRFTYLPQNSGIHKLVKKFIPGEINPYNSEAIQHRIDLSTIRRDDLVKELEILFGKENT